MICYSLLLTCDPSDGAEEELVTPLLRIEGASRIFRMGEVEVPALLDQVFEEFPCLVPYIWYNSHSQ
jgi:hypothetical protein